MSLNINAAAKNFRDNLVDLINDRSLNMTTELVTEINGIINGLDSLKLDNMFLVESNEWRSNFSQTNLAHDQYNIQDLLAQGEAIIYELRANLNKSNQVSMQANQVANVNYLAKQRLRTFLQQLHPYSYKSYVRLDNYAQELGIRDRFSNIRNELVQKNQVNRLNSLRNWTNWTDKELIEAPKYNTPNFRKYQVGISHYDNCNQPRRFENRASPTNMNTSGYCFQSAQKYCYPLYSDTVTSQTLNLESQNPACKEETQVITNKIESSSNKTRPKSCVVSSGNYGQAEHLDDWKKYAREAGINTEFPGTTEMKSRYLKPTTNEYKGFVINPQMDTNRIMRPFTTAAYYPLTTEYQTNYKVPDAKLIDKLPWIKQY